MTDYRRHRVPGGTYFITVNLYNRRTDLLTRHIGIRRDAVTKTRAKKPFDAWVFLPDHLHTVWTLPDGDINFSARWQSIKTEFSKHIPSGEHRSASREAKGKRAADWAHSSFHQAVKAGRYPADWNG